MIDGYFETGLKEWDQPLELSSLQRLGSGEHPHLARDGSDMVAARPSCQITGRNSGLAVDSHLAI